MAEIVLLLILLVAAIAWGFSRTEYARHKMWRQFAVQLLVSIYGFGLTAVGYWVGNGRPLLGLIALSPGSLVIWLPMFGIVSVIVFWPCLGYLLASVHLATYRLWLCVLLALHFMGVVLWIVKDLQESDPSQQLSAIWDQNPMGFAFFWISYLVGQLAMWGCLICQVGKSLPSDKC